MTQRATDADVASPPSRDLAALPAQVAAIREKILAACDKGELEALRIPIDWNETRPLFERGVKKHPAGTDPIEVLRSLSFDRKGFGFRTSRAPCWRSLTPRSSADRSRSTNGRPSPPRPRMKRRSARNGARALLEADYGTPTGPRSAWFFILGMRGVDALFALSTALSRRRLAMSFAVAARVTLLAYRKNCRHGCSTGAPAPQCGFEAIPQADVVALQALRALVDRSRRSWRRHLPHIIECPGFWRTEGLSRPASERASCDASTNFAIASGVGLSSSICSREPGGDGATQRPEWRSLPMQTREALTELMVRLILDHAKESRRPRLAGAPGSEKISAASSGAQGAPLRAAVVGPSGSAQPREQRAAICHADRLTALGWSEIEMIDDDLGRSAAGGVQRAGFERMVAQVCLGKVGAVAAREVSRFARNSRDWQQLIEMCRVVDTVLIDQETIYAPRHGNDRLAARIEGQPQRVRA